MPQPTPQPPGPKPAGKAPESPVAVPPPDPGGAVPEPPVEGTIFRALLDAGVDAVVAYTAEKRLRTMISEAIAPQLQAFREEMRLLFDQQNRRFDEHDRRFDELDRRFDEQDRRLDEHDRRLEEHDRKLDVIVARLDGLKLLGQIMVGAYVLLITVLLAVFGFLFTA